MARRKYTREFKLSAVQLVNERGYSFTAAGKSLGVDPNSVRYWARRYGADGSAPAPSGEGAAQVELRRLREENGRLRVERDILKKAAAFFAREQP